jgi:hypothetical protein
VGRPRGSGVKAKEVGASKPAGAGGRWRERNPLWVDKGKG